MLKQRKSVLFVFLAFAAVILFSWNEGFAQSEKGKKGKKDQGAKKATEQQVKQGKSEKEVSGQGRKDTTEETSEAEGRSGKGKHGRAVKDEGWRPKHLKDDEAGDWKDGVPPGWSRGKKTGWQGEGAPPGKSGEGMKGEGEMRKVYPPDAGDWDDAKRAQWDERVEQARVRVRDRVRKAAGMSEDDEHRAVISVEEAAKRGVPLEKAEGAVQKALEHGLTGEEIEKTTRAMSYGAGKDTDFDSLGKFIDREIENGSRGDELPMSIYKELDEGGFRKETTKTEEAKKEPWWRRVFRKK